MRRHVRPTLPAHEGSRDRCSSEPRGAAAVSLTHWGRVDDDTIDIFDTDAWAPKQGGSQQHTTQTHRMSDNLSLGNDEHIIQQKII